MVSRAERSNPVQEKLEEIDVIIDKHKGPIATDYLYDLPKEFRKHAYTDKKYKSDILSLALNLATTQAFGRPFDGYSEEQIRRSFNLGDTEGAPPGSPPRSAIELPEPVHRNFFVDMKHEAKTLEQDQKRIKTEMVEERATTAPQEEIGFPPRPPPTSSSTLMPAIPMQAPIKAPSPLVLPPAPVVDVSKLKGRRKVSQLTHPEVNTIAEEITKKLRARKSRAWKNKNPLDVDITPQNCAAMGIPQYFDIIKVPMNLQIIYRKVRAAQYKSLYEFVDDVELMVRNALTFNRQGDIVYNFSIESLELFHKLLEKHKAEYALDDDDDEQEMS